MPRDYYAEEIEGKPSRDYYAEEIENKIPPSEGFLKRAMGIGKKAISEAVTPESSKFDPQHPFLSALGSVSGFENVPGLGALQSAERARGSILEDAVGGPGIGSMALNVATDPLTYLGGAKLGKESFKGFGKVFPYTSKESRVAFTKGIEKSLKGRRSALTRGYTSSLKKSKAIVDLSNVVDEGSEVTKFTMKEAQDLKNAISQGIPEAVKSGVKVNPKHFFDRKISGMISDAMKKADPEMASVMEKYGEHAERFKEAIAPIRSSKGTENIFGSNLLKQMFGSGGSIPEKSQVALKEFNPRLYKKVHGAKINQNIFRALRGAVVGGVASKFVPSFLKKSVLSEVTK